MHHREAVPQSPQNDHTIATSEGLVELPILYHDASAVVAAFWVDRARARALVEDRGLVPVRFHGTRALAVVSFYEYRQSSIGPYSEAALAVATVLRGERQPTLPLMSIYRSRRRNLAGFHILSLPVTTAVARAAGREIWGLPKLVTGVRLQLTGRQVHGEVLHPDTGAPLLTVSGRIGPGVPFPSVSPVLLSRLDTSLLCTRVDVRGTARCCLPGSVRLRAGGTDHPLDHDLRTLDLGEARPFCVQHTHRFRARLPAGVEVTPAPGREG